MKRKIIHVITTLEKGGAENQLSILVKQQLIHGHEVVCIPLKGKPELDRILSQFGAVVDISFRTLNPIRQIFALRKLIGENALVLHAHLPRAELISTLAKIKKRNLVLVLSRHNAERFYPGAPVFISNLISRIVTRIADHVIFISNAVKQFGLDNGEMSVKSSKNVVLYGFETIDSDLSLDEKSNFAELMQYKNNNYIIFGTVSRLEVQKDLPTLINAFSKVNSQFKNTKLVIVGAGSLEPELKEIVLDLKLKQDVLFYGRTQSATKVISNFDYFILSSIYEGFGLVLLEAASAGIPTIAPNNSAIPEVMGSNYPALFETSDILHLTKLMKFYIENPESRVKLINTMKERLPLFDSSKMERNIDLVYEAVRKK